MTVYNVEKVHFDPPGKYTVSRSVSGTNYLLMNALSKTSITQCGDFIIILSFIFYVKSILGILEVQNLLFLHIQRH